MFLQDKESESDDAIMKKLIFDTFMLSQAHNKIKKLIQKKDKAQKNIILQIHK